MFAVSRSSSRAVERGLASPGRRLFAAKSQTAILGDNKRMDEVLAGDVSRIRNFSIVAHIDHGKSTLSDRLLERAGNLQEASYTGESAQTLDTLDVERQRGITVKAQGASMFFQRETDKDPYLLNLIDTPGHVDFSCEVSRSLRACEGALLLVDASQGVEAQTIANYELAVLSDLTVIPILTKIDLPHANIEDKTAELVELLGVQSSEVIATSAKSGEGILNVFDAIIERLEPPDSTVERPLQALIYDCWYDKLKGVVLLIYVKDGEIRVGDQVGMLHTENAVTVKELGIRTPELRATDNLRPGQVGYMTANIRTPHEVHLGDTIFMLNNRRIKAKGGVPETKVYEELTFDDARKRGLQFAEFKEHKAVIFAELYSNDPSQFSELGESIDKLCLNDSSVRVQRIESDALGAGYRCGFLGVLHREVFCQRLEDENSKLDFLVTAPSVVYRAVLTDGTTIPIEAPEEMPTDTKRQTGVATAAQYLQPMVMSTILTRDEYLPQLKNLIQEYEGVQDDISFVSKGRSLLKVKFPFRMIIQGFHSDLMKTTSGHGSFDYEECGWEDIPLVKIQLIINGKEVGPLSLLCARHEAEKKGQVLIARLKDVIPRQEYQVKLQAFIGKHCCARELIPAWRKKDVLTKAGKTIGKGDPSRKLKVLKKQADREKKLKAIGNIHVPQEAFAGILKG